MAFDFSKIIAEETKKQEMSEQKQSGSSSFFKTLYPFDTGRLELKLIANEPSGLIYREIIFHTYYVDGKKQTVPCLNSMYGIDCPICNAISKVNNELNIDDAYKKFGYKKRGIMFAKLLGMTPDNYFQDENKNTPRIGDIVLFMFPKSCMDELRNNVILEYQDVLDEIFSNNTTRNVSLKIVKQANGFPGYTFFVKNTESTLCENDNGEPDDMAFNEYMKNMPDLRTMKYPAEPTDEIYNTCRAVAEEINRTYFGTVSKEDIKPAAPIANNSSTISEPINNSEKLAKDIPDPIVTNEDLPFNLSEEVNNSKNTEDKSTSSRPKCFGNNKYDEECEKCPWDPQCV